MTYGAIALGFVALSVAQFCRAEPKVIVGSAKKRYVAAGFDAGDGFLVGEVTSGGFRPAADRAVDHLKPLKPTRSKAEFYVFEEPTPWQWGVEVLKTHAGEIGGFAIRGKVEGVVDGWETNVLADEKRPPVDVIYDLFARPIVHERIARKLTELAPKDVQLIPVKIGGLRPSAGTYFILNVSRRIPCLDRNASRLYPPEGRLSWIAKGVLQRSRARGAQVFRLDEFGTWIIVSRAVKEMLEAERVTGVKLVPLDTTD